MVIASMNKESINHEILDYLESFKEESYRLFASSLIPGGKTMYGVRIPLLRKLAKRIAKEDWRYYLEHANDDSFEEVILQGFVLGCAKESFEEKELFVRRFLSKITDWSVCDGFCSSLKQVKEEQSVWWDFLQECSNSSQEYTMRFALVMWLWYYNDEPYAELIVNRIQELQLKGYYEKMAAAWCLAEIASKSADLILPLLQENILDSFVHQKCIQKICESNKVPKELKDKMKEYRLNKKFTKIL